MTFIIPTAIFLVSGNMPKLHCNNYPSIKEGKLVRVNHHILLAAHQPLKYKHKYLQVSVKTHSHHSAYFHVQNSTIQNTPPTPITNQSTHTHS